MVNLIPALVFVAVTVSPIEDVSSEQRETVRLPTGFFQGDLAGGVEQPRLLPYQIAPGQRILIIQPDRASRRQYRALPEPGYPRHEWVDPQPDVLRHQQARSQE